MFTEYFLSAQYYLNLSAGDVAVDKRNSFAFFGPVF